MAEPLINYYGDKIPRSICHMVKSAWGGFDEDAFLNDALPVPEPLSLMERGEYFADLLHEYLPESYPKAISIILKAVKVEPSDTYENSPIERFLYMPFTMYVSKFGLDHFDVSLEAQKILTGYFTAEFSIRPFIEKYEEETLKLLMEWTHHPDKHVRRLVSEGTRPRLPWASRLPRFQVDPALVLKLLERLKDDDSLYVRRSVANNLNDIGRDNPDVMLDTTERWAKDASEDRMWIVKHAIRSLIKAGHPRALGILGYAEPKGIRLKQTSFSPKIVREGESVEISFTIENSGTSEISLLCDYRIHYVKANGKTSPKVFKLKELRISAGETTELSSKVSFKPMTTRKHYPGTHRVDLLVNGVPFPAGTFELA